MKATEFKKLIREEIKAIMEASTIVEPSNSPEYQNYLKTLVTKINNSNILPSTMSGVSNIRAAIVDGSFGYNYASPDVDFYKIGIIGDGVRRKPFKKPAPFKMQVATIYDGEVFYSDWNVAESKELCKKLAKLLKFTIAK